MKWNKFVRVMLVAVLFCGAMALPAFAQTSLEQVPGSLLVYPIFDIANLSSTSIRITNQLPSSVAISIHTICPPSSTNGSVCQDLDSSDVLTGHETREYALSQSGFLGSDTLFVGCSQGFVVIFANQLTAGGDPTSNTTPISWNQLTGSYKVVNSNDEKYQGSAIAFQSGAALSTVLGSANSDPALYDLRFAATGDYGPLYKQLYADFQAINGGDTQMVLGTLAFATGTAPTTNVDIDFWNQDERRFSHSNHSFKCWEKKSLHLLDGDPRFDEGPLGSPLGSLRISPRANIGVFGAIIETEFSPSIRHMFHTGSQPATLTIESAQ